MSKDLEVLERWEKETGKKFERVFLENITQQNITGYAIDENEKIIGIKLFILRISDISFLKELRNLNTLDLSENQISDYSFLKELKKLTTLYLRKNQISDLSYLMELKNLTTLDLSFNQIWDISYLAELKNLTTLDLRNNKISDISYLAELKKLTTLDLRNNKIWGISFLKELKNLTTLDLRNNKISDISFLPELRNLTTLDLRNNKITNLPVEFVESEIEIKWDEISPYGLNLYGNPLETPPIEIIKKGKDAIKAYFKSLEGEKQPLNEVKVLLVGDGGSGKTSLAKQLLGETFDKNESQTHGINIRQWEIPDGKDKIKVHLWDFGGQEIMHATHQFFLSRRSLYVLVLDGRKEEKTEYWLKHIESFGGNSHVLIVINKIDENPSFDVNRPFLQEKYKGINGFYRISCKNGKGIPDFKESLRKELLNVELCRSPFPKSWFNVKNQLENMAGHYMSYKEYMELCTKETVKEKDSQETLVDFLNDLGIILHFKDFQLEDTYVLEPRWVTNAVYKIINSEKLSINKGVLKLNLLDEILKKKDEKDFFYPREKYSYIIDLNRYTPQLCCGWDKAWSCNPRGTR